MILQALQAFDYSLIALLNRKRPLICFLRTLNMYVTKKDRDDFTKILWELYYAYLLFTITHPLNLCRKHIHIFSI